ncbi:MAG: aminoacyl-tRNA hydrolase [Patescibacteria group bacterium]
MTKLIVGLGNPGDKYLNTRHNAGFMVLDSIARELDATLKDDAGLHAEVCELNLDGEKIILAKPTTFMNRSGEAISAIARKYKIAQSDIWVVFDDTSLPFATLRVRLEGSSGGHNGAKSIIEALGAEDFIRFRVGVNEAPEQIDLEDWVLSKFSKQELQTLELIIPKIAQMIVKGLKDGLDSFTENLAEPY